MLNRLGREEFVRVAREVQAALSDSVVERAIAALPPPYQALVRDHLVRALTARRDRLAAYAEDYYRLLARTLEVYGAGSTREVVELERIDKDQA